MNWQRKSGRTSRFPYSGLREVQTKAQKGSEALWVALIPAPTYTLTETLYESERAVLRLILSSGAGF